MGPLRVVPSTRKFTIAHCMHEGLAKPVLLSMIAWSYDSKSNPLFKPQESELRTMRQHSRLPILFKDSVIPYMNKALGDACRAPLENKQVRRRSLSKLCAGNLREGSHTNRLPKLHVRQGGLPPYPTRPSIRSGHFLAFDGKSRPW